MPPIHAPLAPLSVYAARRARVFDLLGDRALVLPAAAHARRSRDTEYPYRPDSEVRWLCGSEESDTVVVLLGHADEERFVIFTRERDPEAELWAGPRLGVEGARELHGADAAYPIDELDERLPAMLDGCAAVGYRLAEGRRAEPEVRAALRHARERGARRGTGPRALFDPGEVLDDLRLIKDEWEIARMREAAALTVDAFREVAPMIRSGAGEWQVQGRLDGAFRAGGGEGPAYESIVGGGANACVLHYVRNDRAFEPGELVLIDAGASVAGYAADLTRTFPVDGRFTPEARAVYEVVDRARAAAVTAVRPGATMAAVHEAAVAVIVAGLRELGVLEEPAEGETTPWRRFYPHQTSHWLGLDVHDVGDYARDGQSRPLEPGMVLTVEPGLYFGEAGVDTAEGRADRFRGIGVRLEDDVLVTADGHEVLTAVMPTDPEAVAALVAGG
ncbi:aminopeptidase P N-terminal domain-containing protein [Gaopeijia maritima]|uniref:Xaa-Pro aminopeptidase n=1 Tax=Gaopeijia maritima TaxID=3119007 RepID=A0ABU9E9Y2_9BACT